MSDPNAYNNNSTVHVCASLVRNPANYVETLRITQDAKLELEHDQRGPSIQDKSIPAGAAMAELRQVPQATDLDGLIGGWDGLCGHPEHSGTVH